MLCGKYHRIQADRFSIFVVFYGYLSLSIWTQVRQCSVFAHFCQLACQFVCQCDRIRHKFFGLVACISKHHSLVACSDGIDLLVRHIAFFCFQRLVNAHRNIRRLFVQCNDNRTGVCVKSVFCTVVTNLTNRITDDLLKIYMCFGGNLSQNHHISGCGAGFARNTAHRVLLKKRVQNRIGNLIADFIRMSFSNRFGSKKSFFHSLVLSLFVCFSSEIFETYKKKPAKKRT